MALLDSILCKSCKMKPVWFVLNNMTIKWKKSFWDYYFKKLFYTNFAHRYCQVTDSWGTLKLK